MRTTRLVLAATAAVTFALLAGCAPAATAEERAAQEMRDFIGAINGDGDVNLCAGASEDLETLGGWELVEDKIVTEAHPTPNEWGVRAEVQLVDGDRRIQEHSIHVLVPDDGETCVLRVYGFVDIRGLTG